MIPSLHEISEALARHPSPRFVDRVFVVDGGQLRWIEVGDCDWPGARDTRDASAPAIQRVDEGSIVETVDDDATLSAYVAALGDLSGSPVVCVGGVGRGRLACVIADCLGRDGAVYGLEIDAAVAARCREKIASSPRPIRVPVAEADVYEPTSLSADTTHVVAPHSTSMFAERWFESPCLNVVVAVWSFGALGRIVIARRNGPRWILQLGVPVVAPVGRNAGPCALDRGVDLDGFDWRPRDPECAIGEIGLFVEWCRLLRHRRALQLWRDDPVDDVDGEAETAGTCVFVPLEDSGAALFGPRGLQPSRIRSAPLARALHAEWLRWRLSIGESPVWRCVALASGRFDRYAWYADSTDGSRR
jgi:hypothetical protein